MSDSLNDSVITPKTTDQTKEEAIGPNQPTKKQDRRSKKKESEEKNSYFHDIFPHRIYGYNSTFSLIIFLIFVIPVSIHHFYTFAIRNEKLFLIEFSVTHFLISFFIYFGTWNFNSDDYKTLELFILTLTIEILMAGVLHLFYTRFTTRNAGKYGLMRPAAYIVTMLLLFYIDKYGKLLKQAKDSFKVIISVIAILEMSILFLLWNIFDGIKLVLGFDTGE